MFPYTSLIKLFKLNSFLKCTYVTCFAQQELGEAASAAKRRFYERYPEPHQWTSKSVDDWINKAVKRTAEGFLSELKKLLPIADPEHTPAFLEEIKLHYEKYDESPEMTQEKLWMFATSAIPPKMKVKWLQRWNSSPSMRESHRFPKPRFPDVIFPPWLHKATWWAQVKYCLNLYFIL